MSVSQITGSTNPATGQAEVLVKQEDSRNASFLRTGSGPAGGSSQAEVWAGSRRVYWPQGQGMASGVRGYLERRHRTGTPTEVAGVNKAL